jgi:hypothetical protein
MDTWFGHALEIYGARIKDNQGLIRCSVANTLNSVLDDEVGRLFEVTPRSLHTQGSAFASSVSRHGQHAGDYRTHIAADLMGKQ